MTQVVRETEIQTITVDGTRTLLVEEERIRIVTVGTQGPPGMVGPAGPQGPSGSSLLPAGAEGSVVFKQNNVAGLDSNFRYDTVVQSLRVGSITDATMDGGNF